MARILVIDDDEQMRSLLCRILTHDGHDVFEADNGQTGIEIFDKEGADLVITDLVMPEKDGIETIVVLRRTFPALKIIAISGEKGGPSNGHLALQNTWEPK